MPDWQAGTKKSIILVQSYCLTLLQNPTIKIERIVSIKEPDGTALIKENGIIEQTAIIDNIKNTIDIIEQEQPNKIITFGGNCIISQAPFDYLHGKYEDKLGIIWFNPHPDISNPHFFEH